MNVRAIVIEAGKLPEVRQITSYDQMSETIGGYFEVIPFFPGTVAYLDENSKVRSDKDPIPNKLATALCQEAGTGLQYGDWIAGTMVVVANVNAEGQYDGDEHDVPDHVIEAVMLFAKRHAYIVTYINN